jgi:serine/threonine-protein kinase
MGEVFRARDLLLGRDVAVKVLPERFAQDPGRLARFEREVKALAALSHPNIVTVYDYGTADAVAYAVMELLTGETLRHRLRRSPPPVRSALAIARAVAEGLVAAHGAGVVHRDLKPENLFLTAAMGVKILDFGLAQVAGEATDGSQTASYPPALTGPAVVLGTVGYMAPEQLCGPDTDARADLFALGCILYEMLAGRSPFRRATAAETNAAVLRDDPPGLADLGVPTTVEALVRRCLVKDPRERLASARELADALNDLLADRGEPCPVQPGVAAGGPIESVAVLPFVNPTPDPVWGNLGEEIADAVLDHLSRSPRLRVTARSAAFRFTGPNVDPRDAGRALGVQSVLVGRLQRQAGVLVARAELVDVADGSRRRGAEYRSDAGDALAAAGAIAGQIAADLSPPDRAGRAPPSPGRRGTNPEAYHHYLRGRFHWEKRTEADLSRSSECLRAALALDPDFAPAYAALAEVYGLLGGWGSRPPKATAPLARQLAQRALALDPALAEAHAALALIQMGFDWDWPAAEAGLRRAIALNPNSATAQARYGYLLMVEGRLGEALERMRLAHRLDPPSLIIHANIGYVLYFMGRYGDAVEQLQTSLAMDPHFPVAYCYLGLVYEAMGELDRAAGAFQEAVAFSEEAPSYLAALGHASARAGLVAKAEGILGQLLRLAERRYVAPFWLGLSYLGLGRLDEGFAWLGRALEERDFYLIYLRIDPRFEGVRHDPRFLTLANRIVPPADEQRPLPPDQDTASTLIRPSESTEKNVGGPGERRSS